MKNFTTCTLKSFAKATLLGIVATTTGLVIESAPALSANFNFSGNLADPNAIEFFNFTADGTSTVTIQSSSWANGGFDPNLTLFDAAGNWFDERDDIGASNYDFRYVGVLPAGNYQAAIAAFGNNSAGYGNVSTPFNGAGTFQGRTSVYAFDILNVTSATSTAVPEPFSIVGTLVGGAAAFRLKKRFKANNKL